jgi:hypothetical protein
LCVKSNQGELNWKAFAPTGERLSCYELPKSITFAPCMKKIFLLSMLVSFVMICSCQKNDSAAEQQLAQRKVELDAREEALTERKSALDEREKALAEREKALASVRKTSPDLQSPPAVRDPAQVKAERDRRIQQLPPELQALVAGSNPSQMKSEKASKMPAPSAQRQLGPEDLQRQWQLQQDKAKMSAAASGAKAESAETDATSPSPSPTPQ